MTQEWLMPPGTVFELGGISWRVCNVWPSTQPIHCFAVYPEDDINALRSWWDEVETPTNKERLASCRLKQLKEDRTKGYLDALKEKLYYPAFPVSELEPEINEYGEVAP